jgi:hypothetical protein
MNINQTVVPELAQIQIQGHTRSAFLVRASLAAGAVLGVGAVTPFTRKALAQSGGGDVEIVNYALTLEYLEAAFYAQALKDVKGMSADVKELATEIRDNEDEHVGALAATAKDLGGEAVKSPKVDFGKAFASEASFLKFANIFEDTGVSAYNGAAPMIESVDVLGAAGSIVQVEARHAALIRLKRGKAPAPKGFDKASSMEDVLKAVGPFVKS